MGTTAVLLHGFAGTRRGWDLVAGRLDPARYRPLALDLRGHGAARDARPIELGAVVADVLAAAPPRFVLAGYSQGGRVALHVALAAPERVQRLVLLGATGGIEGAAERAARRAADGELAAFAEGTTIAAFADRWGPQPLFADDPPAVRAAARRDVLRNDPVALAAVLRGLGQGVLPAVWDRLGALRMPAAVLVGARDARYVALGERLAAGLPAARLQVVPGAGHGLPREAPGAVAAAIAGRDAPAAPPGP